MLVKDEGLNNCTSWIFELSTILVQCRGPAALSAQHPSHDKDDCMTRQSRICFYSWALAKVRPRSVVMAQLSPRRDTRIPASFPRHLFMGDLLPTNMMFLRHQPLLFSMFHPITGNALMTLNLQMFVINQNWVCGSVCWTNPTLPEKRKKLLRKKVAPLCKSGKYWQKYPPETLLPLLLILKHSIHQVSNYILQLENLIFQWENTICYEAVCTWLRNEHQMTVDGDKILLSAGSLGLFTANFSFTYILQHTFL